MQKLCNAIKIIGCIIDLIDDELAISLTLFEKFYVICDEAEVPSVNVVNPGGLFSFKAGEVDECVQLVVESG